MNMKNKLYCHHKSKLALRMRNIGVASLAIFLFASAITIPTYLSISKSGNVPTLASEGEKENETPQNEEVDEEKLLTVNND